MKKLYITLSFVIASGILSAQNRQTKNADKLFDRFEYVEAANEYLKLIDKGQGDNYVNQQLAESYYNVFNTKEAIKWYTKLVEEKQDAETYYKYAQMLKAEGNYDEANKQMQQFASMKPNDARAAAFKNNPNYLNKLKSQRPLFEIKPSDISSDKSDFGGILTNDNVLYFTSARNIARKTHGWNEEPFLDLYQATYNENGTLSEPTLVDGINTKWHDGPATITSDGNTMYFVSESFNENKFEKVKTKNIKYGRIFLYSATKKDGKWENIKALPINSINYSMRNPSISNDGKTLYFSSDMPGGIGGEDIWKVSVNGDEYGTPENLGENINTIGNESFPFITDDNMLYFTSDSRQGFGGYDVYLADLTKGTEAINVGEPVNSEKDDFSFTFNTNKKVAIFSSNREGVDNIYLASPVCGVNAIVLVKNATTRKPIETAIINVVDDTNSVVATGESNDVGQKIFEIKCEKEYVFKVSKEGYEDGIFTLPASGNGSALVDAYLEPIKPIITEKEVILQPIFFEFNKSNITASGAEELDKLVVVMNEHPNMVIFAKSHTDNRGNDKYNLNLSERRAKATVQYIISKGIDKDRISGQGFGESELKVQCDECTEEEHSQNRRSEFLIIKK
ncbi:cell envelope biogenesis protein OmpA [Flavobacterium sp. 316]|uniref:OmpA family protein n=1 Tax=Flavobacterium sp. 316 TaxID=1603293 RepID=UPI0005DF4421|nr:OmpA family protein [Flavobacterium sp. 316]KIX20750.1 cell envelope biogenesis protein OmpA [Flavobacterium sp. 316]